MEAKEIIKNFSPVAVKHEGNPEIGYSVLVNDENSDFYAWMDVWVDSSYQDVRVDWNQYIFFKDSKMDMIQEKVQADCNVFDLADSCAVEYLLDLGLLVQDDKANWSYGKES